MLILLYTLDQYSCIPSHQLQLALVVVHVSWLQWVHGLSVNPHAYSQYNSFMTSHDCTLQTIMHVITALGCRVHAISDIIISRTSENLL